MKNLYQMDDDQHPVTWEQVCYIIWWLFMIFIGAFILFGIYAWGANNGREGFIANPTFTDNLECNTYINAHDYPDHCDQTNVLGDQ